MGRTISLVESADEIRLVAASPPSGFLHRRGRRLRELVHRRRVTAGTLLIADQALVVDAPAVLRDKLEIPWDSIRKAIVDDGSRWGYVSGVCRFPVYDLRSDGSGSGALIGPLWSQAASLMPAACSVSAIDPVPRQAPNVALILEPHIPNPAAGRQNGAGPQSSSIAILLACADNPDVARQALASRISVGDIDHDDLAYLSGTVGASGSGDGASASSRA